MKRLSLVISESAEGKLKCEYLGRDANEAIKVAGGVRESGEVGSVMLVRDSGRKLWRVRKKDVAAPEEEAPKKPASPKKK